ncbi:hypothetical protein FNF29_06961 [Cafeteria roenbergensis]|uniref:Uroporphyrinogen decarboxylase n=1 Tax=Cafeteria roenbergensis TaxID=33653 RepID=A0A5A8C5U1_CAFRO|nr:hypothetical protein FNF29_06961 [Cafeteria roenbergensis]|eukprot:KAA0148017.1 hypothetical protein FNF29_06961 [Cafeteria roenbergensis]
MSSPSVSAWFGDGSSRGVAVAAAAGAAVGAAAAWATMSALPKPAAAASAAAPAPRLEDKDIPEFPHFRSLTPLPEGRPKLKNDLIVRAARGERTERVPVWAMRQAGRYLPEFRALRRTCDFFTMCETPELAAEVTLQPLRRFRGLLDAVVIFSDILIVPQAMGMECQMLPGKGPVFPAPLLDPSHLDRLNLAPDASDDGAFSPLYRAIKRTRMLMQDEVPVMGFCGGPWTLLAYMVDGGGSRTYARSKTWLFKHGAESHRLLDALAEGLASMLVGQWRAGASALQVFESSAGELSPADFREFSLPYLLKIASLVRARVPPVSEGGPPLIIFARCAHHAYEALAGTFDVVGVDWAIDPSEVVARVGDKCSALQGNLDPGRLYGDDESIRKATRAMLESFGDMPLIANLGWGMHPTHEPRALRAYFTAVHEESALLRAGGVATPASE